LFVRGEGREREKRGERARDRGRGAGNKSSFSGGTLVKREPEREGGVRGTKVALAGVPLS
jgi:hypothetical protein